MKCSPGQIILVHEYSRSGGFQYGNKLKILIARRVALIILAFYTNIRQTKA